MKPDQLFQLDDATVPPEYRGIGVRIEDDLVATEKGMRNLSAHVPSASKDAASWMLKVWQKFRRWALAAG